MSGVDVLAVVKQLIAPRIRRDREALGDYRSGLAFTCCDEEMERRRQRLHKALAAREEAEAVCAAIAELIEVAKDYIDADDMWDADEVPEDSTEATRAALARNERVRLWKRLRAAVTAATGASV